MDTNTNIDKIDEFFLTATNGEIYTKVIEHVEKIVIERALEHTEGNQILAAKLLGINRNTLHSKIKKLNIDPVGFKP